MILTLLLIIIAGALGAPGFLVVPTLVIWALCGLALLINKRA